MDSPWPWGCQQGRGKLDPTLLLWEATGGWVYPKGWRATNNNSHSHQPPQKTATATTVVLGSVELEVGVMVKVKVVARTPRKAESEVTAKRMCLYVRY